MQEDACRVHCSSGFGQRWLGGELFSAGKLRKEIGGFVSAGGEAVVKSAEVASDICCVGAQAVDSVAVAEDKAGEHSGRVGGVWWNEQVEVKKLLE